MRFLPLALIGSLLLVACNAVDIPGSQTAERSVIEDPIAPVRTGVVTACNDGIDNDGDGFIDLLDVGCSLSTDLDESFVFGVVGGGIGGAFVPIPSADLPPNAGTGGGGSLPSNTGGGGGGPRNPSPPTPLPDDEGPRTANDAACLATINQLLAGEQRVWRTVLFGQKQAADAPMLSVRYDRNATPWVKVDDDTWQAVPGDSDLERTDDEVDANLERDIASPDTPNIRRGIFDTRRVLTSELIPELAQSFRALQCRAASICKLAELSVNRPEEDPESLTIQVPGCVPFDVNSIRTCHLPADGGEPFELATIINDCRQVAADLLEQETEILKLVTAYDAAQRSALQFSGIVSDSLDAKSIPVLGTLQRFTDLVGEFERIPCFAGSCDSSPTPAP